MIQWNVWSDYQVREHEDDYIVHPMGNITEKVTYGLMDDNIDDLIASLANIRFEGSFHEMNIEPLLRHMKKFGLLGQSVVQNRAATINEDGQRLVVDMDSLPWVMAHIRQIRICRVAIDALKGYWDQNACKLIDNTRKRISTGTFRIADQTGYTDQVKTKFSEEYHVSKVAWLIIKEIMNANTTYVGDRIADGYRSYNFKTPLSIIYVKFDQDIPCMDLKFGTCKASDCRKEFVTAKGKQEFCPSETGKDSRCGWKYRKIKMKK